MPAPDGIPILFCHYGDSDYLHYSLPCARRNNRDKDVCLLGDEKNARIAQKHGIQHYHWRDFDDGPEIEEFDAVFREIRGSQCIYDSFWLRFVFKRWFVINNFIRRHQLSSFWHFDSDNMILEPLSNHEHHFAGLDCTDQCGGGCLNGFVSNPSVVLSFIENINQLFKNPDYLLDQKALIEQTDPKSGFNEMHAYQSFKKNNPQFNTERLFKTRKGAIFDDCICLCNQFEMELLATGQKVKQLLVSSDGRFYGITSKQRKLVRMASLNLSWVPLYVFKNVFRQSCLPKQTMPPQVLREDLTPFRDLPVPIPELVKYQVRNATRPIRYKIKNLFRRKAA